MDPTYKLVTPDGDEFFGNTADEIVKQMADQKFTPVKSLASYRKATAKRIKDLFNKEIDPSTSETFVESMKQNKLLFDLTDNT